MKAWIVEWLPWFPPIILPGLANLLVAYQKLYRDCRSPLFNPWLSWGFWLWVMIQLTLPGLIFCFYGQIPTQPSLNVSLYWTAIQVGFFFTLFVNANADLGFVNISVDKLYAFLNQLTYSLIAAGQLGRLTDLRQALTQQLTQQPAQLDSGLRWLKAYFSADFSIKQGSSEHQQLMEELERATSQTTVEAKVEAAIALVWKVRRRDTQRALKSLGCSNTFLAEHALARRTKKP